ncbi:MAG TPA: prolyl oligopeptidase family serine peptidase [Actinocrinis sp.]|nr:prolyl oligopeptidase family serine peptidase [Actinocrinis sp.]
MYFLSDRAESGTDQLHRIRLPYAAAKTEPNAETGAKPEAGLNSEPISGLEGLTGWRGRITDHHPLADGRTVAILAEDEPTAEDERRAAECDDAIVWGEHVARTRLWLLDLVTGELRGVDGLRDRHVVEVAQRPDGGPLAVLTWSDPDVDPGAIDVRLHSVDPAAAPTAPVTTAPRTAPTTTAPVTSASAMARDLGPIGVESGSLAWWQLDGVWHLAHVATPPPHLVGGLAVFDTAVPADGTAREHRNLTAGMGVCPQQLIQVADGSPPLALFADGLHTAVHRLDPQTLRFMPIQTVPGMLSSLTTDCSGTTIAALWSTAYDPVNVHAGPIAAPLTRLSDTRPELRPITWGNQEHLAYHATDGLDLQALLILPPGKNRPDGPFSLITLVHGGPYYRYADSFQLGAIDTGQWLAAAGYAVFLPNPRGSSGRGHEFAAAVIGDIGGAEWTDITTGIDLLIAEGIADPDRLGIGGWSHGGFMAAWAVVRTDRFKAALTGAGISDWGMLAATGENGAFEAALGGSHGWEGTGPHPHDQVSPISYAAQIHTPVLILHGEQDTNCPLTQATYLHRALRHFGVEHEFVVYPREGHGLAERNHQLDALHRTRAWFDRWLGDPSHRND